MKSYNYNAIALAGVIAALSICGGLFGDWLTGNGLFITISFIPLGLTLIYFSRDLALERVVKYDINYTFARGAYIVVGTVFVLSSIMTIYRHLG